MAAKILGVGGGSRHYRRLIPGRSRAWEADIGRKKEWIVVGWTCWGIRMDDGGTNPRFCTRGEVFSGPPELGGWTVCAETRVGVNEEKTSGDDTG